MKLTDEPKRIIKYVGYGLAGLMFVVSLVFLYFVVDLAFIPGLFVALGFMVLVLMAVLFAVLQEWFVPGVVTKVMAVLCCVVMIIGCGYINKAKKTVDIISGSETQIDNINIYVLNGDVAETVNDTNGYKYGILSSMDLENTQKVISGLGSVKFSVHEYTSVVDLIVALKNGEVQAIVLNTAYVGFITALEEYEKIEEEIKVVHSVTIETKVDSTENADPTLPPIVAVNSPTPVITEEPFPTGEVTPGEVEPTAEATPTPEPYNGLAYDLSLSVPKEEYIHGNSNIFTVYVSGIDTYGDPNVVSRSDVNILLVVNLNTGKILMINTPRDSYVQLAGTQQRDKLTHAGVYGVDTSIRTLQMLYGVEIDYYVKINFSGFIGVIDALGGVDVNNPFEFSSDDGYHYNAGLIHLVGVEALSFARDRHNTGSDIARGNNQMKIIQAIINKMTSTDALFNFNQLFDALSSTVVTNMQYDRIAELVRFQLNNTPQWKIETYTVEGEGATDLCYSGNYYAWVMYPSKNMIIVARNKISNIYINK